MASLYRDPNSPFWYLKFKTSKGAWRCKSLRPLRHGVPVETRKAKAISDEHSLEEHRRSPQRDSWASWVPAYIRARYTAPNETQRRVLNAWQRLSEYFVSRRIFAPQDLTYRDCMDYMPNRTARAAHNTARFELKILSIICEEAIRRGIISRNPAAKLGIPLERGREKPELTDENIATIRAALKSEPEWMSHAFEIALHQGCRLSETALFRSDVDLVNNRLHFRRTKGDKPFTVPLNPILKPVLENIDSTKKAAANDDRLFDLPPNAARDFHRFFRKLGLPGVTFHSTRVTVASRLARSGYSLSKALRLLNHSSELVHRSYQRLRAEDVADAYEHLKIPTASGSDNPSSGTKGSAGATSKRARAKSGFRD